MISFIIATYGILDYPMRFILSLVMIIVGSIYFNDCKAEPMATVFLIVFGILFNSYYHWIS